MRFFSNCSGPCCTCSCANGCIAGHGDDFYTPADPELVVDHLDKGEYSSSRATMIKYLKDNFDYDYEANKSEQK